MDSRDDLKKLASGRRDNLLAEFWDFVKYYKKWWLFPILVVLFIMGMLVFLSGSGAAPFIYTLF